MPGLRMELDERWSEADVGVAEGLTFAQLNAVDPDLARRLADGEVQIDWPAGETASALAGRVEAALRDLDDGPAPAIVVSHAGPLRIAIALASAVPVEQVAFLEPGAFLVCPSDVGAGIGRGRMLRFRS